MDFDDTDPVSTLAALLTLILIERNPQVEDPEDLTQEQIDEAKDWALGLFRAMVALDYRIVRIPQTVMFN